MVETKDVVNGVGNTAGMVALILLISTFLNVGDPYLEPNYFCESREVQAYCYSLSSTMKTCYIEEDKSSKRVCTNDVWQPIPVVDVVTEVPASPVVRSESGKVTCSASGCA